MRRYIANDRIVPNELTAANVDAPERATHVVTDTNPVAPTDLEVGCEAGTVVIDGDDVSVSAQTESVSDISGEVTQTAYRYHTLSVDATGTLVVRSSDVGEFDANDPDAEPITQVAEPSHETGEVFLGTAFQVEGAIERVFDGRYVLVDVPNSVITQGEGSGLDADTVRDKVPFAQSPNDYTQYEVRVTDTNVADVFNITGAGIILGGSVISNSSQTTATLTIDGDATTLLFTEEVRDVGSYHSELFPQAFDSSAVLEIDSGGAGTGAVGHATVMQF